MFYCRTAKVWKNFSLAYDLKGHEQSVWAVVAIDEERFLTGICPNTLYSLTSGLTKLRLAGSADKTIKFWQQHKVIQTYRGHRDAVRGLTLMPDIGFASCSNDR